MRFLVPLMLSFMVLPMITFFFFCRYCRSSFQWRLGIVYILLSAFVSAGEILWDLPGSLGLFLDIGLLALCGKYFLRCKWTEAFMISVLITSVFSMCSGIISWMDRRIFLPLVIANEALVPPSDGVRELVKILLVYGGYTVILRRFGKSIAESSRQALFQLTIPVFFISLAERIIQSSVYGKEFMVDSRTGNSVSIININHGELLFLQVFACIALFALFVSYEKIIRVLHEEQELCLLKQRSQEQEVYVEEAKLRYEQTRSFRHDIKNHLTVLSELLKAGETEEAYEYLARLDEVSAGLSYPVHTGNTVVDAMVGSKLSIAAQKAIDVACEFSVPKDSALKDMDWCIVLANALDNAIHGCEAVEKERRYIKITGKKKGNFYLVAIENSCDEGLREMPREGTGLANIRRVMERNQGMAETKVSCGVYKLKLLFVEEQQEKGLLHQSCSDEGSACR